MEKKLNKYGLTFLKVAEDHRDRGQIVLATLILGLLDGTPASLDSARLFCRLTIAEATARLNTPFKEDENEGEIVGGKGYLCSTHGVDRCTLCRFKGGQS